MIKSVLFTLAGMLFVEALTDATQLCEMLLAIDCNVPYTTNGKDETLCGTDDVTYSNSCYFGKARCNDYSLHTKHLGACGALSTPPTTAVFNPILGSVFCQYKDHVTCGTGISPVCASNKNVYLNKCSYLKESCDDPLLTVESLEFCNKVAVGK